MEDLFLVLFLQDSIIHSRGCPLLTNHKKSSLIAGENLVQIAPANGLWPGGGPWSDNGRWYNAMTWNGTIPGPVISVDQGDCLGITVTNNGMAIHTLDFHAGNGPSNAIGCGDPAHGGVIPPHTTVYCTLHAVTPGAFMYHCAGDKIFGIWEHIANGMYGGIVVHPKVERPAKEFYMVFGEIYPSKIKNPGKTQAASFDLTRLKDNNPEYILTNGMAFKYVKQIGTTPPFVLNGPPLNPWEVQFFKVNPGELTRWYIVNAGPNDDVAFHFISGLISVHDGVRAQVGWP